MISLSCDGSKKPVKPDNLISKDKMMNILYDAYVLNASKASNRKTLEANGIFPEMYLYEKYDIDSVQFANSNAYYAFDADEYKVLVENVRARLEKDKEKFEEQERIEGIRAKRKRDSLAKANRKKKDSIVKSKNPVRS